MIALKLRKIGKSVGFILPKEMLIHLNASAGQQIIAVEAPTGYLISRLDRAAQAQLAAGEHFMDQYSDVLAGLSKREPSDSK